MCIRDSFYSDIFSQSRHRFRSTRVVPLQGTRDLAISMLPTCSPYGACLILLLLLFPRLESRGYSIWSCNHEMPLRDMYTLLSREIHYNQAHDSRLTPHDLPFKLRPAPTYPFFNYLRYMRYPSLSENIKVDHLLYLVNKSHALPIVIIFLCLGIRVVSQPDTLLYKKQIESLKDHASIQAYLDLSLIHISEPTRPY